MLDIGRGRVWCSDRTEEIEVKIVIFDDKDGWWKEAAEEKEEERDRQREENEKK